MDPNHLACFIHNFSPGRIGNREYPLVTPHSFPGFVFLEAVRNLLRDKDDFPFFFLLKNSGVVVVFSL